MEIFSKEVVKHRKIILLVCLFLLIPSVLGMIGTRINYDMLTYLPDNLDTVKGQDVLMKDYGKGAFSVILLENKTPTEAANLQKKIENVKHVESAVWYSSAVSTDVPMEILPQKYYDAFNKDNATLMAVFFDTSTSADETIVAIGQIRDIAGDNAYVTGMSALVKDLKDLCEKEEPIYVGLAVICATIAMMVLLDSWAIPFIFLASIGMAILYNLGTNYFFGEISYITKALSAVLQLAVTMDYSIFLWHSFEEEQEIQESKELAMENAIKHTITAVLGSSITTVAGFIALCAMTFTLGADLGIVMAKGVIFGVIGCVTTLPALILIFDNIIEKTRHKSVIPDMSKVANLIVKRSWVFIVIFLIILGPAWYGYNHTNIYYDMGGALPKDMNYVVSNNKLQKEFNMASTHMLLVKKDMSKTDEQNMATQLEGIKGVKAVMGLDNVVGDQIPDEMLPDNMVSTFKDGNTQMLIIMSEYKTASKEVNDQLTSINKVVKEYDRHGMVIGEAACTKDLMNTTDRDFKIVSLISIILIFVIIAVVLKSGSFPVILVCSIYFAIFINLGIPYYTGTWLPFIAPICLSTIQLGSTVDYGILLTTRYKRERISGKSRDDSIKIAVSTSIPPIIVSACGFFAATFGVAMYSELDIISSMCELMARGAIVSMFAVIFVLPALLHIFDKVIIKTTGGLRAAYKNVKIDRNEVVEG